MGRRIIWIVAFALVLAACTRDTSDEVTTTLASTTSAPKVTDPGRLVILDEAGDVVVLDPDGSNPIRVTEDAGDTAAYTQPIWGPDGESLAFGAVGTDGFSVGLHDLTGGETSSIATGNLPFYMYFSPIGDRLGVLHNGTTGIDFNLIDVAAATIERVDTGAPYYFSWSPDSDRLVTHVGADRVETIDLDGERTTLEPTGPSYLAPQWTPHGVLHVADDALVVESDDGTRGTVARVSGLTMFVANNEGSHVALQSIGGGGAVEVALEEPPTIPSNRVVVVNTTTGETVEVTTEPALGFFWSPDGEKLLTLIPSNPVLEPHVWSQGGSTIDYPAYVPPATMVQDTFPFFPQYAQSLSFWSPDSSAFAFAGQIDDERGVWVQELANEAPRLVSGGRWVAWSR